MNRGFTQDQINDHRRDLRKHDGRPGDPPQHRLDVEIPQSVEIALLVRNPNVGLQAAADLIEQYAATKSSEAAAEAVERCGNRIIACIEAPLARKVSA